MASGGVLGASGKRIVFTGPTSSGASASNWGIRWGCSTGGKALISADTGITYKPGSSITNFSGGVVVVGGGVGGGVGVVSLVASNGASHFESERFNTDWVCRAAVCTLTGDKPDFGVSAGVGCGDDRGEPKVMGASSTLTGGGGDCGCVDSR